MTVAGPLSDALRGDAPASEVERLSAALVSELLAEPDAATAVWHPLGFVHVKPWSSGAASLRLHVWPMQVRPAPAVSPIHDHVWDLVSQVLCGELVNHIGVLRPAPGARDQRALVGYIGTDNVVEPTGEAVRWEEERAERLRRGDRYRVPPGTFHYTEPGRQRPLATVVLARVVTEGPPQTLLPVGAPPHRTTRAPCSSDDLRRELERVREALSATRSA